MPAPHPRLARLFSLSGIVPLGVFLVLHLAINARALRSAESYARAVDWLHRVPALAAVEALLVFAPLALHASIGVWLAVTRKPLVEPAPYHPGVAWAMRVTGVIAIAFVAMHLPELRFRQVGARLDGGSLGTLLVADLSSTRGGIPWRAIAYLFGTAFVTFHFVVGLWAAFARSRAGQGRRARFWAAWWAGAVGGVMWILFANVVVFHATGARLFGSSAEGDAPGAICPPPAASGPR